MFTTRIQNILKRKCDGKPISFLKVTPALIMMRLSKLTDKCQRIFCTCSYLALICAGTMGFAENILPQNGQVTSGSGSIAESGSSLQVNQTTNTLSVDWDSFSIGADNRVTFVQPSPSSTAVNRVTGVQPSSILGNLDANGRVFLINPSGILFGAGAQVNVGSLIASTLDVSEQGSDYIFEGTSTAGIKNAGLITAATGGTIALIAAQVENTGTLTASEGTVAIGSGSRVRLSMGGLVDLEVEEGALDALIEQGGAIVADGGQIYLGAKAAGDITKTVINHTGVSQAHTLVNGEDGEIYLMGDMELSQINVGGQLDASAPDGGDGGFIETSAARVVLADDLRVSTKSVSGKTGTWLIDPTDIEVVTGEDDGSNDFSASQIKSGTLAAALASSNVTIATNDAGDGNGDINVNAGVTWTSDSKLTLSSHNDIFLNATLDASGGNGGLALHYGQASADGSGASYFVAAPVHLNKAGTFETKQGSGGSVINYTILTDLGQAGSTTGTDLQGMSGNLAGHYVLGADIDASDTETWNGGAGFSQVGGNAYYERFSGPFTGTFDGLGHVITELTINRPDEYFAGLFGETTGVELRNIGLEGGDIIGAAQVGSLVGIAGRGFTITNAYSTADVSGGSHVGGLVGFARLGTITNAYATGDVSGEHRVGGLLGFHHPYGGGGTMENVYATGDVIGVYDVGGLVGATSGNLTISNAYATGDVKAISAGDYFLMPGGIYAGGLVGSTNPHDTITNAYATGNVSGYSDVGGLVGHANVNTTITNAYATGDVNAISAGDDDYWYESGVRAGGLVGDADWDLTITNSYATGNVSGSSDLGGLLGGSVDNTTITGSFWDAETTGQSTSYGGGTGLTSVELRTQSTYTNAGWDFDNDWFMLEGETRPFLRSEYSTTITNAHQLQLMAMDLSADYTIANDIDLVGPLAVNSKGQYLGMWGSAGFDPVGSSSDPFTGTLDGLDHVITGLTIDRPDESDLGLFGRTSGAELRNVGLEAGSIAGMSRVGGLVGTLSNSTVSKSYSTDDVSGSWNVGGLVGDARHDSTITNTHATGNVSGVGQVGGLVGYANSGNTITSSYATGDVSGSSRRVGGLIGKASSDTTITNAYATGKVSGGAQAGGLVGYTNSEISINDAFATGNVSGSWNIGGLVGDAATDNTITNTYATGNVSGVGQVGGLLGYANSGNMITGSYATGDVSGSFRRVGGLVGKASTDTTITNAYATGNVSGGAQAGGLVGYTSSEISINDAFATGNVSGSWNIGGLVGDAANDNTITNTYATGNVSGVGQVGGLVGYGDSSNSVASSFWDTEATGQSTSFESATGLTTSQMQSSAPFTDAGWDISTVAGDGSTWYIDEGNSAPRLSFSIE